MTRTQQDFYQITKSVFPLLWLSSCIYSWIYQRGLHWSARPSWQRADTREAAIRQPAHHPRAHDNSCLVPAQGPGCNWTGYVMRRSGAAEQRREGSYRDVSQCIIVCRANRLALGGALFWQTWVLSMLVWLTRRGVAVEPAESCDKTRPDKSLCIFSSINLSA